jgi:hypothetical protein
MGRRDNSKGNFSGAVKAAFRGSEMRLKTVFEVFMPANLDRQNDTTPVGLAGMKASAQLEEFIAELITEGSGILSLGLRNEAAGGPGAIPHDPWSQFMTKCRTLIRKLHPFGADWEHSFDKGLHPFTYDTEGAIGALKGIRDLIRKGRLSTIEEQVAEEVLNDLRGNAEVLLQEDHYLACCVVLRAVLEERLRKLCEKHGCNPTKPKPTIGDFDGELYRQTKDSNPDIGYTISIKRSVELMATIGNDAAHNLRAILKEDAVKMMRELDSFLKAFPV